MHKRDIGPAVVFGLLYLLLGSALIFSAQPAVVSGGGSRNFGSSDYVEYWSALRVVTAGNNPYSPADILKEQRSLYKGSQTTDRNVSEEDKNLEPLMMWNPPWLLVFMAPILLLPFPVSVATWVIVSVILLIASSRLLQLGLNAKNSSQLWLLPSILIFHPTYYSLKYGQLGSLLVFGCALLFHGLMKRCNSSHIAGLILLSVKPHLFLVAVPVAILLRYRDGANRGDKNISNVSAVTLWSLSKQVLIAGFIILLMCLPIEIRSPGATVHWKNSLVSYGSSIPGSSSSEDSAHKWISAALFSALPKLAFDMGAVSLADSLDAYSFRLPIFLILAFYSIVKLTGRKKIVETDPSIEAWRYFCGLTLSILIAPFAWHFDSAPLALVQAYAINQSLTCSTITETQRVFSSFIYICLSLLALILELYKFTYHHEFVFFPITFFVILLLTHAKCSAPNVPRQM